MRFKCLGQGPWILTKVQAEAHTQAHICIQAHIHSCMPTVHSHTHAHTHTHVLSAETRPAEVSSHSPGWHVLMDVSLSTKLPPLFLLLIASIRRCLQRWEGENTEGAEFWGVGGSLPHCHSNTSPSAVSLAQGKPRSWMWCDYQPSLGSTVYRQHAHCWL
jgi:hypothetical protein